MQPPQNPYDAPGNPVPQSPVSPSVSPRAGRVSLDALSDAMSALTPTLLTWIGAGLLCFALALVYGSIQRLIVGAPQPSPAGRFVMMPAPTPASVILQIVSSAFSLFLSAAVFNMALHQLRTGRAEIGKMFGIGDVLPALIVGGIITSIAQGIGWIVVQILVTTGTVLPPILVFPIVFVPGLIAGVLLMMVVPLIVDQKLSGVAAVSRSLEVMANNIGGGLLIAVVLFLACCFW